LRFILVVAAAVIMIWALFPVYWLAVTGVKTPADVLTSPPVWFPDPDWHPYRDVLFVKGGAEGISYTQLTDSLIISIGTTILSVTLGAMAAYVCSIFPANVPTGGKNMASRILIFRMFPPVVSAFPLLWLFFYLPGLSDTHLSLIIAFASFNLPFVVYIMKTFFDDIPRPILEAGLVDGYSPFRLFWKIALPLATGGLVSVTALCFIFSWNEFFMSLILTGTRVRPWTLQLASWMACGEVKCSEITLPYRAALATIGMVPPIVLVWILGDRLVRGMTLGTVRTLAERMPLFAPKAERARSNLGDSLWLWLTGFVVGLGSPLWMSIYPVLFWTPLFLAIILAPFAGGRRVSLGLFIRYVGVSNFARLLGSAVRGAVGFGGEANEVCTRRVIY